MNPPTPIRHACKAVRVPASLASPANQITVPLDKGERARKLCFAKRRGKGVLDAGKSHAEPRRKRGESNSCLLENVAGKARAGRASPPRSRRIPFKKSSPANFFGRRPPLNQRRATPYVPAVAPNSLSEGLHEPSAGQRPASPQKTFPQSPKAESLAEQSTGQRPVFPSTQFRHGCKPVRVPASRTPPANQNKTVPLETAEPKK